jgi:phosphoribosylglycinamide formyltransferase 1
MAKSTAHLSGPMISDPVKLGLVLSGRGSNAHAIIEHIQAGRLSGAMVACVLSNRADAPGLTMAQGFGIPTFVVDHYPKRADRDAAMLTCLQQAQVDWVILAGYDRIIGDPLLSAYAGRVLNIHPSLLPAFGGPGMVGLAVHQAVIAAGEHTSGCTVHQVTAAVDEGQILGQAVVDVYPSDTAEILAARVLEKEHQLYAAVIQQVVVGKDLSLITL